MREVREAALHGAALYVARADDHAAARAEVGATVEHLLAGLSRGGRASGWAADRGPGPGGAAGRVRSAAGTR